MQLLKLTTPSVIIQVSFLQILKSFFRKRICIKIKSNTKVQRLTACRIYLKKVYDNCFTTNVKHNKTTHEHPYPRVHFQNFATQIISQLWAICQWKVFFSIFNKCYYLIKGTLKLQTRRYMIQL